MSEHRPTVYIQCDVFPPDDEDCTPEAAALWAWEHIQQWVLSGYQPVVEVIMGDGSTHNIDLEEQP